MCLENKPPSGGFFRFRDLFINMIRLQSLLEQSQTQSIIKDIEKSISELLPYVVVTKNNVMGSTATDGSGKPIVRIDSKQKPTALWVKVDHIDNIVGVTVKTIVNNKENNLAGHGKKLFGAVADIVTKYQSQDKNNRYEIVIDDDQSGGFWKHTETQFPDLNFRYV